MWGLRGIRPLHISACLRVTTAKKICGRGDSGEAIRREGSDSGGECRPSERAPERRRWGTISERPVSFMPGLESRARPLARAHARARGGARGRWREAIDLLRGHQRAGRRAGEVRRATSDKESCSTRTSCRRLNAMSGATSLFIGWREGRSAVRTGSERDRGGRPIRRIDREAGVRRSRAWASRTLSGGPRCGRRLEPERDRRWREAPSLLRGHGGRRAAEGRRGDWTRYRPESRRRWERSDRATAAEGRGRAVRTGKRQGSSPKGEDREAGFVEPGGRSRARRNRARRPVRRTGRRPTLPTGGGNDGRPSPGTMEVSATSDRVRRIPDQGCHN